MRLGGGEAVSRRAASNDDAGETLEQYLDELTCRFNRRRAEPRGLHFHRLIQQSIAATPTTYARMVETRRHLIVVRAPERRDV